MNPLTWLRLWETVSNIALGAATVCSVVHCVDQAAVASTPPPAAPPSISQPAPAPAKKRRHRAQNGRHEMVVAADADHQCHVTGRLTGPAGATVEESFLLDSGATPALVLDQAQAVQVGLDPARLDFGHHRVQTANGVVRAAEVRLADFRIDGYRIRQHVAAWIIEGGGIGEPVIGAAILHTLSFRIGPEDSCSLSLPGNPALAAAAETTPSPLNPIHPSMPVPARNPGCAFTPPRVDWLCRAGG
ncbi:MAG: retropepsin-like aspartic protease family protein [Stellaceae bacterium]